MTLLRSVMGQTMTLCAQSALVNKLRGEKKKEKFKRFLENPMPSLLQFLSADKLSTSNPDLITISFFICLQNRLKPQSAVSEQKLVKKKKKKNLIPEA